VRKTTVLTHDQILALVKRGDLVIDPFDIRQLGPASYDVRIADEIGYYDELWDIANRTTEGALTIDNAWMFGKTERVDEEIVVHFNQIVLARSVEWFEFPDNISGLLIGRSSIGRLGLFVIISAGWFDPGFKGYAVFEVFNANRVPIKIKVGERVAQMVFYAHEPTSKPYSGKYQRQRTILFPGSPKPQLW